MAKPRKAALDGMKFYEVVYVNPLGIEQITICAGPVTESYKALLREEGSELVSVRELV